LLGSSRVGGTDRAPPSAGRLRPLTPVRAVSKTGTAAVRMNFLKTEYCATVSSNLGVSSTR
jgi:hypothetical protein